MSDNDKDLLVGFVWGIVLTSCAYYVINSITSCGQDDWWRKELVRRGHASFYLDSNNNRQWNWNKDREETGK